MTADDALLLAYVDGQLAGDEAVALEARLRGSADARDRIAKLRASQFDYAAAFATQKLPPVPATLMHAFAHAPEEVVRAPPPSPASPMISGWLAAACIAGAFALGVLTRAIDAPARFPARVESAASLTGDARRGGMSPWVDAAAGYQALYTRETVDAMPDDPAAVARAVESIRRDDKLALRVPDLRAAGLALRSIQRLRFHGKPLVQLVYLPANGPPLALCVTRDAAPDQPIATHERDALRVVTWRQAELGYALIGARGDAGLRALAGRIADAGAPPLFDDPTGHDNHRPPARANAAG